MKVRQGWSGQVSENPDRWAKFDLELEEEDLRRELAVKGFPAEFLDRVPVNLAFQLLEVEAEILVLAKLIGRFGYTGDGEQTAAQKLSKLTDQKTKVIEGLKELL